MTPEYELNEILWKSVRGADSPMPPPVRAGFIRVIDDDDDEAEDAPSPKKATDRKDAKAPPLPPRQKRQPPAIERR